MFKKMARILIFLVFFIIISGCGREQCATNNAVKSAPQINQAEQIAAIEAQVESSMKEWNTSGMALTVVKDGKTLLLKGYGKRNLHTGEPVTINTRFYIASITKVFTATLLAKLVEDGKLSWDDPVKKHISSFAVNDTYFTENLTIRDVVAQRSGMGPHFDDPFTMDLVKQNLPYTLENVLAFLKTVKPLRTFRQEYGYSNTLSFLMGPVIQAASGSTWEEYLKSTLLVPLKMNQTGPGHHYYNKIKDVAVPYVDGPEGEPEMMEMFKSPRSFFGAAGSLFTSARDMEQFLKLITSGGEGIFKNPQSLAALQIPHVFTGTNHFGNPSWKAAGLGWDMNDHQGLKVLSFDGFVPGFLSIIVVVPDLKLGIAIMINKGISLSHMTTALTIVDIIGGLKRKDYDGMFRKFFPKPPVHKVEPAFAKDMKQYAGSYTITVKGQVFTRQVIFKDGKLYMDNSGSLMGPPMGPTRLFPMAEATFFSKTADLVVLFTKTSDGYIMKHTHSNDSFEFKKVK